MALERRRLVGSIYIRPVELAVEKKKQEYKNDYTNPQILYIKRRYIYIFKKNKCAKIHGPDGVEELDGALPEALWLGVFLTAHCMERGAWAALLAWEELVVLSKGSSKRNVSWSTSSL